MEKIRNKGIQTMYERLQKIKDRLSVTVAHRETLNSSASTKEEI